MISKLAGHCDGNAVPGLHHYFLVMPVVKIQINKGKIKGGVL
jgi:hypothetical protein